MVRSTLFAARSVIRVTAVHGDRLSQRLGRQLDAPSSHPYAPTELSNTNYQANAVVPGPADRHGAALEPDRAGGRSRRHHNAALCRRFAVGAGGFYGINYYFNYSTVKLLNFLNFPLWHNVINNRKTC